MELKQKSFLTKTWTAQWVLDIPSFQTNMKIANDATIAESVSSWKQNNPMPPKATVNPFVPNAPFLYPLKTSENLTENLSFLMFSMGREGWIGNKWVNAFT